MSVELLPEEDASVIDAPLPQESLGGPIGAASKRIPWPATTIDPRQIRWRYALGIPLIHVLACLAFVPWFFSWTGVVMAVLGLYVFGTLGINLCYHRLLTHSS
jgi:stearoyl-CoA desaturase (delta-9 desaturase)